MPAEPLIQTVVQDATQHLRLSAEDTAMVAAATTIVLGDGVESHGCAAVYHVHDDDTVVRVVLGDDWWTCTCQPSRGVCAHILAAKGVHGEDEAERTAAHRAASEGRQHNTVTSIVDWVRRP